MPRRNTHDDLQCMSCFFIAIGSALPVTMLTPNQLLTLAVMRSFEDVVDGHVVGAHGHAADGLLQFMALHTMYSYYYNDAIDVVRPTGGGVVLATLGGGVDATTQVLDEDTTVRDSDIDIYENAEDDASAAP